MMSVKIVSGEASESDEEFPATSLPSPSVSASPLHRPRTDGRETPDSKAKNSPSRKKHYTHRDDKRGEKVVAVSPAREKVLTQSAVVSGEASESSDDEMEIDTTEVAVTPLQVNQQERGDSVSFSSDSRPESQSSQVSEKEAEFKYDTLFHRKLRQKNANLRKHFCETLGQVYISSAKEIRSMTHGLMRSLVDIQDVSENMRSLTNTLFSLEDKVDIISGCNLLPNIDISPANTPTAEPQPTS